MRTSVLVAVLVASVCGSGNHASADETEATEESANEDSRYQGVTPGSDNLPPKAEEVPKGAMMVTWPGFQMLGEGASRFFIQTSNRVKLAKTKTPSEFVLILRNTKVHLKNNWLPLETQFFETPVTRATVQRRGPNDIAMVFELREDVAPKITQQKGKDGYNYIFVDFAAE